jgi:hypothetical protein
MAVWMFFSVLLSGPDKFSDLGKSKLTWFLLSLAALIPYIGLFVTLAYLFTVRIHFPSKPAALRPDRGQIWQQPGPTFKPTGPVSEKCSCTDGKILCTGCSGKGWLPGTTAAAPI